MYVHTRMHIYVYTKLPMRQKYIYVHKYIQMHACKHMYRFKFICIYMCIYTNVFTEGGIEVHEARLQIHARQSKSNFGECAKCVYVYMHMCPHIDI